MARQHGLARHTLHPLIGHAVGDLQLERLDDLAGLVTTQMREGAFGELVDAFSSRRSRQAGRAARPRQPVA